MRIRANWVHGTLIVQSDSGGYVFSADQWPSGLDVRDLLRSLCGEPDAEGYYAWHDSRSSIEQSLDAVSVLSSRDVGALAIRDSASVGCDGGELRSLAAAGTLAVAIFEKSFKVSREDAMLMVRMNIVGQERIARA